MVVPGVEDASAYTAIATGFDFASRASRGLGIVVAIATIVQGVFIAVTGVRDYLQGGLIAQGFFELADHVERAAGDLKNAHAEISMLLAH